MAGRRSSQIMKKVRVTNTAVIIEAMMPMISVTANPLTGPVPNWKRKSAVMHRAHVGVDDGVHGVLEPLVDRETDRLPVLQLLADALEDEDVGVHRDTDREHDAREPRQRQRGVDHREAARP